MSVEVPDKTKGAGEGWEECAAPGGGGCELQRGQKMRLRDVPEPHSPAKGPRGSHSLAYPKRDHLGMVVVPPALPSEVRAW